MRTSALTQQIICSSYEAVRSKLASRGAGRNEAQPCCAQHRVSLQSWRASGCNEFRSSMRLVPGQRTQPACQQQRAGAQATQPCAAAPPSGAAASWCCNVSAPRRARSSTATRARSRTQRTRSTTCGWTPRRWRGGTTTTPPAATSATRCSACCRTGAALRAAPSVRSLTHEPAAGRGRACSVAYHAHRT